MINFASQKRWRKKLLLIKMIFLMIFLFKITISSKKICKSKKCKNTFITDPLKNLPKNKILAKFSILLALMNVLYLHRLKMIAQGKIHNAPAIWMRTLLTKNLLEKHSKKNSKRVFQLKTQYAILHLNFHKKVILKVCIILFKILCKNSRMSYNRKGSLVTVRDQNVSNCIVNAFKNSYFVIKTVIVTVVEIRCKISKNINRPS